MTIQHRKSCLKQVGIFLSQFKRTGIEKQDNIPFNDLYFDKMKEHIEMAVHHNGWFTKDNVLFSMEEWSQALTEENLSHWLKNFDFTNGNKTVAVIMAGNIPLVGFHDFISVLISGNKILVKQSSSDQKLLPIIAEYLIRLEPEFESKIEFTPDRMKDFDAVIATGSNNTARYFEYYFKDKPSVIRKNRNSVAVLTGNESKKELELLSEDIFRYFGLGCRNVSKLYVPKEYNFDSFFKAMLPWADLMNHAKYANNYDYNKAVYLMSEFKLLENGFLMLKQDESFGSPIATLFYETYDNPEELKNTLEAGKEHLQCIVSKDILKTGVKFGQTQHPRLWDYADNVNTLDFLKELENN